MFKCHPLLEALPDHFTANCNPSHPMSYTPESESASRLFVSNSLRPHGLYSPWNSPGQNTGVGSHSLLQGIFPTQGLNPGLLHCRWILYQLSHKGSPRILEWEPFPSPVDFPDPESNRGLLHCRRILYQFSYHGSPSDTPNSSYFTSFHLKAWDLNKYCMLLRVSQVAQW